MSLCNIFKMDDMPIPIFLWPPLAFFRALYLINTVSYQPALRKYTLNDVYHSHEMYSIICFLIAEIPIYLGLGTYLQLILPSEFGVSESIFFPLHYIKKTLKQYKRNQLQNHTMNPFHRNSEELLAHAIPISEEETKFEDADVKAERKRVLDCDYDLQSPLVVLNLRKLFKSNLKTAPPKLAVKDVSFAVEKGVVFGLLGPNGAGKSTLLHMLTGLYPPSAGSATVAGYSLHYETKDIHQYIGVCPQFDILWPTLTVKEHLVFYARLKGVRPEQENAAVSEAMQTVALHSFANRQSKGLSGGERRRLSIAIALLGNPKVVFFDEPSTGLDPEVRRLIWDIVDQSRVDKTVVLTTHSMEEAEALCSRVAIMAKGTLRCLANPLRLKELYGSGYKLFMNTLKKDTKRACSFVENILPAGWKKIDAFETCTSYEFPASQGFLARLFREVEESKIEHGILDWGLGQTTLEEVFLKLIGDQEL